MGKTRDEIKFLLTGIVMPGTIQGCKLAGRLLAKSPKLRVIYTSGYSPNMAGKDLALVGRPQFSR